MIGMGDDNKMARRVKKEMAFQFYNKSQRF